MVWRMDAGDFAGALDIAEYVIQHALLMPDRFERTTGTIVAEEIAEVALKAQKAGGTFDVKLLLRTEQIAGEEDMPDQAKAKLHLALGKAFAEMVSDDDTSESKVAARVTSSPRKNICPCAIERTPTAVARRSSAPSVLKKYAAPAAN